MTLERDLLRTFSRKPAPDGFADRVLERLDRRALQGAPPSRRPDVVRWLSAIAAGIVLLVAGAQYYRHQQAAADAARVQEEVRVALQIAGEKLALVQRKLQDRQR